LQLPIFPLNTVLFPDGVLPLRVFEARYMDMVSACMKNNTRFGVCLIRDGSEVARKRGEAARPEDVGCMAQIVDFDMEELGVLNIVTRGMSRFRVVSSWVEPDGLIRAETEAIASDARAPLSADHHGCSQLLANIIAQMEADHGEVERAQGKPFPFAQPYNFDDAGWVANRLCEVLPVPLKAKQKLMELEDPEQRIAIVHTYLTQKQIL
jgi:Lon protease-like protein